MKMSFKQEQLTSMGELNMKYKSGTYSVHNIVTSLLRRLSLGSSKTFLPHERVLNIRYPLFVKMGWRSRENCFGADLCRLIEEYKANSKLNRLRTTTRTVSWAHKWLMKAR